MVVEECPRKIGSCRMSMEDSAIKRITAKHKISIPRLQFTRHDGRIYLLEDDLCSGYHHIIRVMSRRLSLRLSMGYMTGYSCHLACLMCLIFMRVTIQILRCSIGKFVNVYFNNNFILVESRKSTLSFNLGFRDSTRRNCLSIWRSVGYCLYLSTSLGSLCPKTR